MDIRQEQFNSDSVITSGLSAVSFLWASPILFDQEQQQGLTKKSILKSSAKSWLLDSNEIKPHHVNGKAFFAEPDNVDFNSYEIGALVEGVMTSYFAKNKLPFSESEKESTKHNLMSGVLRSSVVDSRIIMFSSSSSFSDYLASINKVVNNDNNFSALQLISNSIDYAFADVDLLKIRSKAISNNSLISLVKTEQLFLEYMSYLAIFLMILFYFLIDFALRKRANHFYSKITS